MLTVKRLNDVRWSSRELCLKVVDKRYDILLQVLEKVIGDKSLEDKQRAVAVGLRQSFLKKEIVATTCFFKEIFGITGPLNKYLQGINMDLGKANDLVYDPTECAYELMSFAKTFNKLKSLNQEDENGDEEDDSSDEDDEDNEDDEHNENDEDERVDRSDGLPTDEEVENSEKSHDSHLHALKVLANPTYRLVDAYRLLYKMYAIALALPVGSCTAEQTFSVL